MEQSYARDVVIIGSGPAGYTAAIYAARGGNKPLLIEGIQPGGQLTITTEVENFPGFAEAVQGPELMMQMRSQAERMGTEIISDWVEEVDFSSRPFKLTLSSGDIWAQSVIISTGAQAKWLGLPSEEAYMGRGVSACATCDGFFFRGKPVAVVGGGDTAAEEALYLTKHASEVFLIHRRGELRASKVMADRVAKNPKIILKWFRELDEVLGENFGVTGVRLKDPRDGSMENINLEGVFIAIGHKPNTDFLKGHLELDETGLVVTKPGTTQTSVAGVFAAGDVQDSVYRQAITAAGTGCMAALDAARFLGDL